MPPKKKKPSKARAPQSSPAPRPAKTPPIENADACPVAAFGASAGGLEAFQEVLQNLPDDTGIAYVFIQHLDPKHVSVLGELLARSTRMPVVQVEDQMPVERNHVYVIPPNVGMRLEDGRLALTKRVGAGLHLPIDEFFQSLADSRGSRSIAVVLSGTASDGTLGLKAVKAVGGITFAQDETARFDAMPRNAIAAGWVDMVLPPDRIAREIARLCRHPYVTVHPDALESAIAKRPALENGGFEEIFQLLRRATGVDFTLYKQGTLQRRILRRMALHKLEASHAYVRMLREDPTELQSLFHDILISVTGFFREPATFDALKKEIFPLLFRDRTPDNPVRVWVPGCATGEEPYSVAICLVEHMQSMGTEIPIQIFGTDLSEAALSRARAGIYPESVAADVSPDRLRRFFVKVDGQYQISRPVRDKCIFAQQNLTKDPPFSNLDLITCRNVLIYLGPALQAKAMRFFHYALKPDGYLVLGLSETAGNTNLFNPVGSKLKIYARVTGVGAPYEPHIDLETHEDTAAADRVRRAPAPTAPSELQQRMDHYILSRYSPPALLIDEGLNILQFHGRTSPYLEHSVGEPVANMNRMLRHELVLEFRKLLERSQKNHSTVRSGLLRVADGSQVRHVNICIAPLVPANGEQQYLVLFEEQPVAPAKSRHGAGARLPAAGTPARRVRELEAELTSTKQYLESVIEEQQAATEELKSANEEVQSSNEELQSTNEELLTAKEELQSTNEELTTVNDEMHSRNLELMRINDDLNNLLASVNIPIVMLGNDLRIRRFTPQAEKVLNLLPTDVGRPLGDFKSKIDIPDLEQLFLDAIDNLTVKERQVQDREGRWYTLWVRPYRTLENRIDGAVMVLVDITDRRHAAEARYRRLFEAAREGIILVDAETGEVIDLNPYMAKIFGLSRSTSVGLKYWDLEIFAGADLDSGSLRRLQETETLRKDLMLAAKTGGWMDVELNGHVFWEGDKRIIQINLRDLSDRSLNGAKGEPAEIEAIGRLAGVIAHDFNNLLTTVGGYAQLLKQDLPGGKATAQDAEKITSALERATLLTRQVLAFGRKHQRQAEVLDLNTLLREIELIIRATMPARMELQIELEGDLRPVKAERGQMEQAILNLVRHARRAVPGTGALCVTTRNATIDEAYAREHPAVKAGEYVVLEVSSSGPSTDATRLQVLEPLLSASDQRYAALSVAGIYDAVRRSGGYLWAASELGRGNTFRIFLPPAAARPTELLESAQAGVLETGSETVLLVEPDELVRGLTGRVLAACGYQVWEAAQASDALERLRQQNQPPQLLLTEVVMPDMSGRELADRIAAIQPDVRVLFMSGYSDETVESSGVSGYDGTFLRKPFTPEVLTRRIREVLTG